MYRSLDGSSWTLECASNDGVPESVRDRRLPATVPGCVHLDLIRAGLIEHPNIGTAELDQLWIGEAEWRYTTTFEWDASSRTDLVCAGLDTIAEIRLNGVGVGRAANMFHDHRFDVSRHLNVGVNTLEVIFTGPLRHAMAEAYRLGSRPVNGDWGPYAFIRKSAAGFGWDWGPRIRTCGIWRSIGLETWNDVRLATVRPLVRSVSDAVAVVDVLVDLDQQSEAVDAVAVAEIKGPDGRVQRGRATLSDGTASVQVIVPDPRRWWPVGLGEPTLYDVNVFIESSTTGDEHATRWSGRIGLRTVELDATADDIGTSFGLRVNGVPIVCRGANWIPDSVFPSEVTAACYHERIGQALDANMNMLRVWGGGVYEHDAFYRRCDEVGMLVWQDFMFACAMYPEEEPVRSLAIIEAEAIVSRLSPHPSIVMLCGGNENILAYQSWGWRDELTPGQTWGSRYWLEWLPDVVSRVNPTLPYWPDSPYSGDPDRHANDPDHGDRHTWDDRVDGYRDHVPRFVSEFGHQAPANLPTLTAALGSHDLDRRSPAMQHRQRATLRDDFQYDEPMAAWFRLPSPDDEAFIEWHYLAQLMQARAIATGIEYWRASPDRCRGMLIWQLNDVWTGHSWSMIDDAGRPKLLWYAMRRSFSPRLVTIQPSDVGSTAAIINDTADRLDGAATITRMDFDGVEVESVEQPIDVPAYGVTRLDLNGAVGPIVQSQSGMYCVTVPGLPRAFWYARRDRDLVYPSPLIDLSIARDGDRASMTLSARSFVRDLMIRLDHCAPDVRVETQLITMLPGERRTIEVSGLGDLADADVETGVRLHTVHPFGAT